MSNKIVEADYWRKKLESKVESAKEMVRDAQEFLDSAQEDLAYWDNLPEKEYKKQLVDMGLKEIEINGKKVWVVE